MANQEKEPDASDARNSARGYSHLSRAEDKNEVGWGQSDGHGLELTVTGSDSDKKADSAELLLEDLKVL